MGKSKARKILIGGGGGYIGSALVPFLIEQGYDVTVIDLFWFGNHLPKGTKIIKKDLFDCDRNDFKGFDQFIFLAGISNDPMAEYSPAQNFIYNAALPAYLAFECKLAGVKRYIYASSCSVYGFTDSELFDEKAPTVSNYPYGISKLQGERGVLQLQDKNFSVIALRQGTVCGPSPRMRFDLIVNTMFKSAITNSKITINNPAIWRPIYDISDAMTAYLCSIKADYSISGVFNVTSGNYTVGQVGSRVKETLQKLGGKVPALEVKNIYDLRNYKVSCKKAKTKLGFKPKSKIPNIVADLYANKHSWKDYEKDEYYNIRIFEKISRQPLNILIKKSRIKRRGTV